MDVPETVERLAKALFEISAEPENGDTWEDAGDGWQDNFRLHARTAIAAMNEALLEDWQGKGRFANWSTADMSAQCRMQARSNLDPELTAFMNAVADRLAALAKVASPD